MRHNLFIGALALVIVPWTALAQQTLPTSDDTDVIVKRMTLTDAQLDDLRAGAKGGVTIKGVWKDKLVGDKNPKSCCSTIVINGRGKNK